LLEQPQLKDGEGIGASEEVEGDMTTSLLPIESTIKLSPDEVKALESVNGKKETLPKVVPKKEGVGIKVDQKRLQKPSTLFKVLYS